MKKLVMFLIASVAVTAVSYAATNTVSSANIVGYVKLKAPVAGKFKLLALTQFDKDGTGSVDIQDIINNLDELNAAVKQSAATGADKLYVYNAAAQNYKTFALFKSGGGQKYWISDTETIWDPTFGAYVPEPSPASFAIARATSCWLATGVGGNVTNVLCSGDVYTDATAKVNVIEGFTLISYPYSSDIALNNLVISNATAALKQSAAAGADKLYVYNATTENYSTYALFQSIGGQKYWISDAETIWDPTFGAYVPEPSASTNTISLGSGFWYSSSTTKDITFTRSYNIN